MVETSTIRTLVVDDSGAMRKILSNYLGRLGFEKIEEASNGRKAIFQVAVSEFDLVLMDWNMPEMNGLDALKAIRSRGFTMPVVMVTTEGDKQHVIQALAAGANNYIVKPCTVETLGKKLWETLDLRSNSTGDQKDEDAQRDRVHSK